MPAIRFGMKSFTPIIVAIIIILVLIVGFFIFLQSQTSNQSKITPTPIQEPTPTKKPEIDREKVKIQVLNGTGTPGQAGTAVEALTKAGYIGDNIKSANAGEFDTIETTISAKKGFEEVANDVKEILKETFNDAKVDPNILPELSEFDIVITTGGKKFEEETKPSTTPNPTISSNISPSPSPTTSPTSTPTPTP